MKIVFMGTPEFASVCLSKLINSKHQILAVFSQPDKKKGRGHKMQSPPTKILAEQNNIPVFQFSSLKELQATETLKNLNPDIIVVVAYGKILPKNILNLPRFGCINVHGSLLPKLRGAAPIQRAIINGEKITGITTMYMEEGLDIGDIILKKETKILENETSSELFERLAPLGAELLLETLSKIEKNIAPRLKQQEEFATLASMLKKEESEINFELDSKKTHDLIRGLTPWPGAFMWFENKKLKIFNTINLPQEKGPIGKIKSLVPFIVYCKTGAIEIKEVQPDSKKRMNAGDFFRGYRK